MIFYFIYSGRFNSKVGGHYQSLKTISKAVSKETDVFVFILGHSVVDIYTKEGIPFTFVKVSLLNLPFVIYKLLKRIKKQSPKCLHAFDSFAYYIVRILSFLTNTPSCLTKCGGPNFAHLAVSQSTIFFSDENFRYYSNVRKYKLIHKYLIPNRVVPQNQNLNRLNSISLDPEYRGVKFLRINRIGVYYKKTMVDSINLVNFLNNNGIECRLYIIGYITEENIVEQLPINDHVRLLTDEKFYVNASELIPLFDCVIGTGRSAMEAFTYEKIVLSPILNGDMPILVEEENIQSFLSGNFSERVNLALYDKENYQKKLLSYDWKQRILKNDSLAIFNRYFNIESVIKDYLKIYSSRGEKRLFFQDFLFHTMLFTGKNILDFFRGILPSYNLWFARQVMKIIGGKVKSG